MFYQWVSQDNVFIVFTLSWLKVLSERWFCLVNPMVDQKNIEIALLLTIQEKKCGKEIIKGRGRRGTVGSLLQ
jgi:hypothetical protein